MIKKVLTKKYGQKNIVSYIAGDENCSYIGAKIYVLLPKSLTGNKKERYTFKGVVDQEGKELVDFNEYIIKIIGVNSDSFIVERLALDTNLGGINDYVSLYELYKVINGKVKLLFVSDKYILFNNNKRLAVYQDGEWIHSNVSNDSTMKVCSYNNKPITHLYDMNTFEDKVLINGKCRNIVNDNILIISSKEGEYLYDIKKGKKVSDTFNSIFFRDSYFECLIFFIINTSTKSHISATVRAQLQCNIDENGNYVSLIYDTLNDTYIDPRNPSFNIEKEALRIKNQLIKFAKPDTTNNILTKKIELFN